MTNTSKIFNNDGNTLTVASGGAIVLEAGATLTLPGGDAEGTKTFTGDVTISNGSDLIFSGTTGQNKIKMVDNLANALAITEGSTDYLSFTTTNSSEAINLLQNVAVTDAKNIAVGSTTGTKIGTAASQKIGFFNATPVVQQDTTGTVTGFTAGSGTAVKDDSTFTGDSGSTAYTIGDVVLALKNLGFLAA